ncbi:hypothetical protein BofuT4_P148980.1 [Botrytis cinerea T4]|uniref:Core Histone H2A/H2B/H3 domain-containing protein n=1 Tax=Botryotinia fuckeliana (strain T4) TaxID=999810 RepID=G2YX50_BOTF4|nr:hypothetical protein BofuT4_P148980.1 [Botrytis cinerea T4]
MPPRRQHLRELARNRREEIARRSRQMPDQEAPQGFRYNPTHGSDQPLPHFPKLSTAQSPIRSPTRSPTPQLSPRPSNHQGRAQTGVQIIESSRAGKTLLGRKSIPKKDFKKPKLPIFKHKTRRILPNGKRVRDLKLLSREIKFYSSTWVNLIPRASFARLVREVAESIKDDLRFQKSAIEALQEATEMMLAIRFDILQDMARHAHRTTIMGRDAGLLQRTLKKAVGIDDIGLAPTSEGFRGYKA